MIVTALSELLIDMNYIFVFHIFMMRYWISRRHKDSESVKILGSLPQKPHVVHLKFI